MKNKENDKILREEGANASQSLDGDLRRLAGLVADFPDREPPEALTRVIMGNIRPKRLGLMGRIMWKLRTPIFFSPFKMVVLGASFAAAVLLAAVFLGIGPEKRTVVFAPPKNLAMVVFTLEMPDASSVHVVGSFNGWKPEGVPMCWDHSQKLWTLSLPLERGRYEYAFLVDGKKLVQDPKALLQQEDGFGNRNSVLIIERKNGHEKAI